MALTRIRQVTLFLPGETDGFALVDANTWLIGHEGLGLLRRDISGTRLPNRDGVTTAPILPYMPERPFMLGLQVNANTPTELAATLAALHWNLARRKEAEGLLRVRFSLEGLLERDIECSLQEIRVEGAGACSAYVDVTFWASQPHFWDPTSIIFPLTGDPYANEFSGYLFPVTFPWASFVAMKYLADTATNAGSAPSWPVVSMTGPAVNPYIYNWHTAKFVWLPATLSAADTLTLYMDGGYYEIQRASGLVETSRNMILGSTPWPMQPGFNKVMIAAVGLTTGTYTFTYYKRYLSL